MESMLKASLEGGGYRIRKNMNIGTRPSGGRHIVDFVAFKNDEQILISSKWQQTSGTAEQKIPFEVICLGKALIETQAMRAYLVLGGTGWSMKDYFLSSEFKKDMVDFCRNVVIIDLEHFVAKANKAEL